MLAAGVNAVPDCVFCAGPLPLGPLGPPDPPGAVAVALRPGMRVPLGPTTGRAPPEAPTPTIPPATCYKEIRTSML